MTNLALQIDLISDTTFGRGDGLAGVVDAEVEHDAETGLPIIKGRTLKGLLVEECANLLYALEKINSSVFAQMETTAVRLFGVPGSDLMGQSILHIGTAILPQEFVKTVTEHIAAKQFTSQEVLEALTTIRYQTAIDAARDTPLDNTLRAMRVIKRKTTFTAPLIVHGTLTVDETLLLVACTAALHRAGQSRNRGRGRLIATLIGLERSLADYLTDFEALLKRGVA